MLHDKHVQEGPNLYSRDLSSSVVELISCTDLVYCLQAKLLQTQLPPDDRQESVSAN